MGIVRSVRKAKSLGGTLKGLAANEHSVTYIVTTDDPHTDKWTVMDATGIVRGMYYDLDGATDLYSICTEATPRQLTDYVWEIEYKYTPIARGSKEKKKKDAPEDQNPLNRVPDIEWDTEEHYHIAWKAYEVTGITDAGTLKPVMNRAGGRFSQPLMKVRPRQILRYARNEATYPVNVAEYYMHKVNSDTFLGWTTGKVYCRSIRGTWHYEQGPADEPDYSYWRVNYVFAFDEDGWIEELLNEGAFAMELDTPYTGLRHPSVKKVTYSGESTQSVPMTGPFLLADNGDFLSESDVMDGNVTYIKYRLAGFVDFGALSITIPY